MTEYCRHCGEYTRYPCSAYSGDLLASELRSCPNLPDYSRYSAMVSVGANTTADDELDALKDAVREFLEDVNNKENRERLERLL